MIRRPNIVLILAIFVATAAHGALLLIEFQAPPQPAKPREFDITIVNDTNKQTESQPDKTDFLANADSDGGRNDDQSIRHDQALSRYEAHNRQGADKGDNAATGTPSSQPNQEYNEQADADSLTISIVKIKEGDDEVAHIVGSLPRVAPGFLSVQTRQEESPNKGKLSEDNQGERVASTDASDTKAVSPRARKAIYARYVYQWRHQVEQLANKYYLPKADWGKRKGAVTLEVKIARDGALHNARVTKSSGDKLIDQTALYIIHQAAPYAKFPPYMAQETAYVKFGYVYHFGLRKADKPN